MDKFNEPETTYKQDTERAIEAAKEAFALGGWIGAKIVAVQPSDRGHLSDVDKIESIVIETTEDNRVTLRSTVWDAEPSIEWD